MAYFVLRQVDELARRRGSTSYASRGGVANFISHFAQTLLKDFFEICQHPNEAEVLMLTEACELEDEETTELWCKSTCAKLLDDIDLHCDSRAESRRR